jgi:ribose/xylose/arabinose/galactoside ABC-type transport system permease subunit
VPGIAAIGITLLMISGEFDLSVGSIMAWRLSSSSLVPSAVYRYCWRSPSASGLGR